MRSKKGKFIALAVLLVVVILGVGIYFKGKGDGDASKYPQYLNFSGKYVLTVPKEYSVDEQSVPGVQIIYSGSFTVSTLEDVYNVGGMSLQSITDLSDHSGKGFKKYVEDTFMPALKKELGTDEVSLDFDKVSGSDVARIRAKKDGKDYRFVYLKNGEHPVGMVAKTESAVFRKIAESLGDVEKSDLKDEIDPTKNAIKNAVQLVKDKKVDELYAAAGPGFRSSSTKEQVSQALENATEFLGGNINIAGGSYDEKQNFSAVMRFTKLGSEEQKPAFGSVLFTKLDGKWKLVQLSLPSPQTEETEN